MRSISDYLEFFRRQRLWTRALVAAIPEEHFDWRPDAESFSCGDLVRHLMQAEIFWTRLLLRIAEGEEIAVYSFGADPESRMSAFRERNLESSHDEKYGAGFAEALERWREIQLRTEGELAKIPQSALYERSARHPLTEFEGPLWQFLLFFLAHEAHHRGQLSAYLKILGVAQPAAALGR